MDKKDLVEADSQMNADLEAFRLAFNIEQERFYKGYAYCEQVIAGGVKSKIYADVFEVPIEKARQSSSQFHNSRWIQELILFLRPNEHTLYFGERKRIIQAGMHIIDDPQASRRDKIEAMKALQPYIKAEIQKNDEEEKQSSIGAETAKGITEQVEKLSGMGKMVDENGEIIDVTLIE